VFTARYALSPYIKQTRFVFKGLMCVRRNLYFIGLSKISVFNFTACTEGRCHFVLKHINRRSKKHFSMETVKAFLNCTKAHIKDVTCYVDISDFTSLLGHETLIRFAQNCLVSRSNIQV
jgi:hypothetical protein